MAAKYTKDSLLIISKDVVNVFMRDYERRNKEGPQSIDKYASELVEKIFEENPSLKVFLNKIKETCYSKDPRGFNIFCSGFGLVYDLFRKQAGVNKLEADLNTEE